mgnify:CR=1 FL=1
MVPVTEMQNEIEEAKRMERYIQLAGEHARDTRAYEEGYSDQRSNISFTGNQSREGSVFSNDQDHRNDGQGQPDSLELDSTDGTDPENIMEPERQLASNDGAEKEAQ